MRIAGDARESQCRHYCQVQEYGRFDLRGNLRPQFPSFMCLTETSENHERGKRTGPAGSSTGASTGNTGASAVPTGETPTATAATFASTAATAATTPPVASVGVASVGGVATHAAPANLKQLWETPRKLNKYSICEN